MFRRPQRPISVPRAAAWVGLLVAASCLGWCVILGFVVAIVELFK